MNERICPHCGIEIPINKTGYVKELFMRPLKNKPVLFCSYKCCREDNILKARIARKKYEESSK